MPAEHAPPSPNYLPPALAAPAEADTMERQQQLHGPLTAGRSWELLVPSAFVQLGNTPSAEIESSDARQLETALGALSELDSSPPISADIAIDLPLGQFVELSDFVVFNEPVSNVVSLENLVAQVNVEGEVAIRAQIASLIKDAHNRCLDARQFSSPDLAREFTDWAYKMPPIRSSAFQSTGDATVLFLIEQGHGFRLIRVEFGYVDAHGNSAGGRRYDDKTGRERVIGFYVGSWAQELATALPQVSTQESPLVWRAGPRAPQPAAPLKAQKPAPRPQPTTESESVTAQRHQHAHEMLNTLNTMAESIQRTDWQPRFSPTMSQRQISDCVTWFGMGINTRALVTVVIATPTGNPPGFTETFDVRVKDMWIDAYRVSTIRLVINGLGEQSITAFTMQSLTQATDPDALRDSTCFRVEGSWDKVPQAPSVSLMPGRDKPIVHDPVEGMRKVNELMPIGARISRMDSLKVYETSGVTVFLYYVESGNTVEAAKFYAGKRRVIMRWMQGDGGQLLARVKDQFDQGKDEFYLIRTDANHFEVGHGDEPPVLRFKIIPGKETKVVEIIR